MVADLEWHGNGGEVPTPLSGRHRGARRQVEIPKRDTIEAQRDTMAI